MQYMHQAVHLLAVAVLGAVNTVNPRTMATTAKMSTKTFSFRKSFIFSHLLSPPVGNLQSFRIDFKAYQSIPRRNVWHGATFLPADDRWLKGAKQNPVAVIRTQDVR
jgi:hypothetical protein